MDELEYPNEATAAKFARCRLMAMEQLRATNRGLFEVDVTPEDGEILGRRLIDGCDVVRYVRSLNA